MTERLQADVAIIGGGIVGSSAALFLRRFGLSAYGLTGALVEGNVISRNERFGVVLLNAGGPGDRVVTLRGNRGEGNGFGFGNYNAMGVTVDAPGAIAGRSPAPATAPRVADAQGAR